MQSILNSSQSFSRKNSFINFKPLKNENISEEMTRSRLSKFFDNSGSFGQENESPLFHSNEGDLNFIFSPDPDYTMNECSLESEKILEKQPSEIMDENLSMLDANKSILSISPIINNLGNLNDSIDYLNGHKLFEEDERLFGESFLSKSDIPQNMSNLDIVGIKPIEQLGDFNEINELKDLKNNLDLNNKTDLNKSSKANEVKKTKINFLVTKNEEPKNVNPENAPKVNEEKNKNTKIEQQKNEFIGKKRETLNKKINNLHEINKVTIISSKAYKCECGKIFSTEENQKLHYINIHLHEKPYNCSFCGEGFSHRNGKIYHERVYHTFIFPYPCNICSFAFASKSALLYHIKSKHKVV